MEKILLRGRGLLRRPLYPACTRWGALSVPQQRLQFSSSPNFSDNPERKSRQDRFKLPETPCRTRFAPSPTGYLHLGSLRTALYNYLLARATGGQFVLRLEDTDRTRLVPDAEEKLYEDLRWAGLSWDEGPDKQGPYGPYRQSERLPLYNKHANELVREGKAYRCFCSPEALEEHKKTALESGLPPHYPGTCRNLSLEESDDRAASGQPFAIRFKSGETPTMIHDIIYNRFQNKHASDDHIIMKRDGFPTYHFANVVDDRHMEITHVIRGAEWLVSTPKHVELYNAFGWEPPKFAHLGLLVDDKRQKLSKRDNRSNMAWYKDSLILPDALLNFAALLGWRGRGSEGSDCMSLQEMADNFTLQFSKGDIMVNISKLPHLQDKHLKRLVEDTNSTEKSHFDSHVLNPIKDVIEEVEAARKVGATTAPGGIPVAALESKLPAVRILEDRFRGDLVRALQGVKFDLVDPIARFGLAVSNIRYHIWEIPPTVLLQDFQEIRSNHVLKPINDADLNSAMAYLVDEISAVDDGTWTREELEQLLRNITADPKWEALSGPDNQQRAMYKLLRWALTVSRQGMPIAHTMEILGREETVRRLNAARQTAQISCVAGEAETTTPAE